MNDDVLFAIAHHVAYAEKVCASTAGDEMKTQMLWRIQKCVADLCERIGIGWALDAHDAHEKVLERLRELRASLGDLLPDADPAPQYPEWVLLEAVDGTQSVVKLHDVSRLDMHDDEYFVLLVELTPPTQVTRECFERLVEFFAPMDMTR